ncbi:MAG: ATP-binding protein, partial [Aedoeadaptatus pacaensis]
MIQHLPIYAMAILFVSSLILLLISMDICIDVLQAAPKSPLCFAAILLVLASLAPAQILAEIGTGEMLFGRYFLSAPLRLFVLYYIFILILEWVVYKKVSSIKKNQIGKNSIKESMDNLPDGICFSKLDGTPLLVNRQMQEISYDVFGKRLVND